MKVIKFLQKHDNGLALLQGEPYNLKVREEGDLVLLKYDQIKSNMADPIVQECRGLILDRTKNWEPVCVPFDKFFNFGESNAYQIDLSKAKIVEKVDGSIIKVYFYNDEWRIATNGTINSADAPSKVDEFLSFEDMFFDIVSKEEFKAMQKDMNQAFTYIFELIHPMNPIVVNYQEKSELVLLGRRDNFAPYYDWDLTELEDNQGRIIKAANGKVRLPKVYEIAALSFEELTKLADQINVTGADAEGFIVYESSNGIIDGRVKVKSPKYLSLHHLAGEGSLKHMIIVILDNEVDEVQCYMNHLPKVYQERFENTLEIFTDMTKKVEKFGEKYKELAPTMERKELAILIQKEVPKKLMSYVFGFIDGRIECPRDWFKKMTIKNLKTLLLGE